MAAGARRQRWIGAAATVALALALALPGCALFEPEPPPVAELPKPPEPAPPATDAKIPRPTRKPPVPSLAARPPEAGAPEPARPESPLPPPVDPERLKGLDEAGIAETLGTPTAKNEVPPGKVWRYFSRDCEIDIYFYLDLKNRMMRALHYEVRSLDSLERNADRCFQQLVDERRQRDGTAAALAPG